MTGLELDELVEGIDEIEEVLPEEDEEQGDEEEQIDEEDDEQKKAQARDPYHGKSREDIIKELENERKEAGTLKKEYYEKIEAMKIPALQTTAQQEEAKDILKELGVSSEEVEAMTATEVVKMIAEKIPALTEGRVETILKKREQAEASARDQITKAKETYPALSKDVKYRSVVKMALEVAKRGGESMTLDEACQKANEILQTDGSVSEERVVTQQKKSRAIVETGSSSPVSPRKSDNEEERIRKLLGEDDGGVLPF